MGRYDRATRVTVIIAVLSLLLSGFVTYSYEMDTTHQRITAVEIQQKNDGTRLERIEHSIDRVEDKVDKLLSK